MTTPYPLGRLLFHDERSRGFPAPTSGTVQSVSHKHSGPWLDQGSVSSCTGNMLAQLCNTLPHHRPRGRYKREPDAIGYYTRATQLDTFPGEYPAQDTGSTGLAVCKAGVEAGVIGSYDHAFGLDHAIEALQLQPQGWGINWYEGMFNPDRHGVVAPTGALVGGHEFLVYGVDMTNQWIECGNSWGPRWGLRGRFRIALPDAARLLGENGDVVVPQPTGGV